MGHLFNGVNTLLTKITWLHQIFKYRDQIKINNNKETKSIFSYENGNQIHNLIYIYIYIYIYIFRVYE